MLTSGRVVFSRHGRGHVRQAGRPDRWPSWSRRYRRRARLPDGERHAQPRDRRDRQAAPRARQPLRRHLRQDAAAHAARGGDRRRRAGARGRGRSDRHPGRRLDHRRRQGRPALPRQRHHAASRRSTGSAPATGRRRSTPPTVRQISIPTTLSAGEFSGIAGVTDERTKVKELFRHPAHHPAGRGARSRGDAATRRCGCSCRPASAPSIIASRASAPTNRAAYRRRLGAARPGAAGARPAAGEGRSGRHRRRGSTARSARGCRWAPLAAGVPMGASHGIGYVLGAVFDIPHGHTSCIMLPSVMRWNKSANADAPGAGRQRHGPSRRGCRRRARCSSSAGSACRAASAR